MKILVTGAAGFIGSHLCERLSDMGHEVLGVDSFNDYYSVDLKRQNEQDVSKKGVKIIKADLSEVDALDLKDQTARVSHVYHLAAQPGISAKTSFETYLKNNILATQNLSTALFGQESLKMFVNISTSSVYGFHATDSEEIAPKPTSYYGVTKLAAEQFVLALNRDKGFPACSMRLFSVYGERERPEKLYPKLIDAILNDKEFPLYEGSEKHIRSYTYVGDIIDGLISVIDNENRCAGEIFNIGTDETSTTGENIEIVEKIIGKKAKIMVKQKRPGDQLETRANISKARDVLGYNPKTKPEVGLKKEVDWFKEKIWKKINLYQ